MGFNREVLTDRIQALERQWRRVAELPRQQDLLDPRLEGVQYEVISSDKALRNFVGDAQILIAPGAYFGDEAKGKVGNALSRLVDAVFRLTSGQNTGRTVIDPQTGEKYIFHGVPSAILEGKECFIGPECTIDPISLLEKELLPLSERGKSYDNLQVGNFHLVNPYHRIMDFLKDEKNNSTGVGIAPAHASVGRRTSVRLDDVFGDRESLVKKLEKDIRKSYVGFLAERELTAKQAFELIEQRKDADPRVVPDHVLEFARAYKDGFVDGDISATVRNAAEHIADTLQERVKREKRFPKRVNVVHKLHEYLSSGKRVLLEPTQSVLLSRVTELFYGKGTSPDTAVGGLLAAGMIKPDKYKVKVLPVFKFPSASRVGSGPIPAGFTDGDFYSRQQITSGEDVRDACDDFEVISRFYFDHVQGNGLLSAGTYFDADTGLEFDVGSAMAVSTSREDGEKGATTGKPRITGLFDCVLASYIGRHQGEDAFISCMDRGDHYEKVGLVVGYVVSLPEELREVDSNGTKYRTGQVIRPGEEVPNMNVLKHCKPIIKVMDGWKDTPISNYSGNVLPNGVNRVLETIEHHTGLRVMGLGIGPKTDDTLYIRRLLSNYQRFNALMDSGARIGMGALEGLGMAMRKIF